MRMLGNSSIGSRVHETVHDQLERFNQLLSNPKKLSDQEVGWMRRQLMRGDFVAAYLVDLNGRTMRKRSARTEDPDPLDLSTITVSEDGENPDAEELEDAEEVLSFYREHPVERFQ